MTRAVTLRQLRYLVALADTLHFGRAASACHVSQPSLSAQLQLLEEELGAVLVERTRHRVLLTPAGEEAVRRAREILAKLEDLGRAVASAGCPLSGPLKLGVIPTVAPFLLPRVLPRLRTAYPELRLFLREDLTERLLDRLKGGDLEAALLAVPLEEGGLETAPLYDEPFVLALPPGATPADPVRPASLDGERLLLLEDGHCFRDQALDVCRLGGGHEVDGFAATSLATLVEMVAGGLGATLLPALAVATLAAGGQVELRSFARPEPTRRIGLAWRRGSARRADLQQLATTLRSLLPEGVTPVG